MVFEFEVRLSGMVCGALMVCFVCEWGVPVLMGMVVCCMDRRVSRSGPVVSLLVAHSALICILEPLNVSCFCILKYAKHPEIDLTSVGNMLTLDIFYAYTMPR